VSLTHDDLRRTAGEVINDLDRDDGQDSATFRTAMDITEILLGRNIRLTDENARIVQAVNLGIHTGLRAAAHTEQTP
jgi:hypothetical protein